MVNEEDSNALDRDWYAGDLATSSVMKHTIRLVLPTAHGQTSSEAALTEKKNSKHERKSCAAARCGRFGRRMMLTSGVAQRRDYDGTLMMMRRLREFTLLVHDLRPFLDGRKVFTSSWIQYLP
jgi:pre-mRNA-splicing factor ATP-dependent RNA helicase DHX38/PRP16